MKAYYSILNLLFLLGICHSMAYSQSYNKAFLYENLNTIPINLLTSDNNLYLTGYYIDTSIDYGIKMFSSKYDINGNVINAFFYRPTEYVQFIGSWYYGKSAKTDLGYMQVGYAEDTGTGNYNLLLCLFDTSGQMTNYFVYPPIFTTNINTGITCMQSSDKYYYMTGILGISSSTRPFVLKADSLGNMVWLKYYPSLSMDFNAGFSILETDSGHITVAVNSETQYDPPYSYLLNHKTTVLNLDTAGNVLSFIADTGTTLFAAISFQKTIDGGYISCGEKLVERDSAQWYITKHGVIIKWDSAFNKVWEKDFYKVDYKYCASMLYDIKALQDGSYIACGNLGMVIDSFYYGNNGWLLKIDKEGNEIWSREYRSTNYPTIYDYHWLYDLDELPNGDIIAVGEIGPTGGVVSQQGWLLRVDSSGCLYDETWCGYTSIEVEHTIPLSKNNELAIFPNPVVDILTLEIDQLENLKTINTEIEIFDVMGKTMQQNKIINEVSNDKLIWKVNISQFKTGLYLVRILDIEHKVVATGKFVKE